MKLSICGFCFQKSFKEGKMDVFHYLESVKYRYHLDTVDIWNGTVCEIDLPLLHVPDDHYILKIKQALDDKGMTLINFAIDGAHIWDEDPDMREKLYQSALDHLRMAKMLGAKTVRIDTGGEYGGSTDMTDEQFDYIVKRYKEFCDIGIDNGYKVGPENHMGPSLNPHHMKRIAEAVDHPNYGILLHLDRWVEDAEIGDEVVAPWVCHIHFDPRTATADDAEDRIKMLLKNGYDGYWSIEHNPDGNQHIEIEWLLATVKRLLINTEE